MNSTEHVTVYKCMQNRACSGEGVMPRRHMDSFDYGPLGIYK